MPCRAFATRGMNQQSTTASREYRNVGVPLVEQSVRRGPCTTVVTLARISLACWWLSNMGNRNVHFCGGFYLAVNYSRSFRGFVPHACRSFLLSMSWLVASCSSRRRERGRCTGCCETDRWLQFIFVFCFLDDLDVVLVAVVDGSSIPSLF